MYVLDYAVELSDRSTEGPLWAHYFAYLFCNIPFVCAANAHVCFGRKIYTYIYTYIAIVFANLVSKQTFVARHLFLYT